MAIHSDKRICTRPHTGVRILWKSVKPSAEFWEQRFMQAYIPGITAQECAYIQSNVQTVISQEFKYVAQPSFPPDIPPALSHSFQRFKYNLLRIFLRESQSNESESVEICSFDSWGKN